MLYMKYKDCHFSKKLQEKSVVKFRQTKILDKTNHEQITVASEKLNKQLRSFIFVFLMYEHLMKQRQMYNVSRRLFSE